METTIAGIDVHKQVLMVVILRNQGGQFSERIERRRFGAVRSELKLLRAWLLQEGVEAAVMESTAQYWKPVWLELEGSLRLELAQAYSNRARRGRKCDFKDAERLARRFWADELVLSYVPVPEQRILRTMTRAKVQLARDRNRLQNQIESLLEEMRIKLSSVLSDLLGTSGQRILWAIAKGETDPAQLAALASHRVRCGQAQLMDALDAIPAAEQRQLLKLHLRRLELLDAQIEELHQMTALAMKSHEEAVVRLAEVPGFGPDSAQQVIAEVGPDAHSFNSAAQFTSWAGTCPGKNESAEQNHSSRSAKGNKYLRRVLTEVAQAAVKVKDGHYQNVFRRLLPRLGYKQALWAVVHRLSRLVWKILHDRVHYIEQGTRRDPKAAAKRAKTLSNALRKLGYSVFMQPLQTEVVIA
jgi:transposase